MSMGKGTAPRFALAYPWVLAAALIAPGYGSAQDVGKTQAAPAASTYQINEYLVRGNTLLDAVAIEKALEPFLGPERSMADMRSARDTLQKLYQSAGYQSVVVEIPPQQVKGGVVLLKIAENEIGHLRIVGAKYHSPQAIRDAVPALAEGTVPNFSEVQKQLADLNRQPGRQVVPVLSPGSLPQTMDATLKVDDTNPLHGSVEVNNEHSAYTPELRTIANVRYDNLWQLGHTISASYIVAPQDRHATEVYALSYLAPLNSQWSLLASGYKSNSNANVVGGTTVLGKGDSFSLQATRQLPTLGQYSQSVSVGISHKRFDQNVSFGGASQRIPATYMPLTLAYSGQRVTEKSSAGFTLTGNFGLRGAGSGNISFDNQRVDARENFAYLRADFNYLRAFAGDFALALRFSGQVADMPLLSSEQFAAGGDSTVRGYLAAEVTADKGGVGSVELRTPSVHKWLGGFANEWRFLAFLDGARMELMDPLAGQRRNFSLLSTGVGTRFIIFKHLDGQLEYAYPLQNGVQTKSHDGRLLFSVKADL